MARFGILHQVMRPIWCLIAAAIALVGMRVAAQQVAAEPRPPGGLLCNIDCTEFFLDPSLAGGKAGEVIDRYVDDVPRRVGVTYRDVTAPGEKYQPPLPVTSGKAVFSVSLGPVPSDRWLCDLAIEYSSGQGDRESTPMVFFDGRACDVRSRETTKERFRVVFYGVSAATLTKAKVHEIKVIAEEQHAPTIQRVETWLREPGGEGGPPQGK